MKMKLVILLAVLWLSGCSSGRTSLPLRVTAKARDTGGSGHCYLRLTDEKGIHLFTVWGEKYCAYEMDQEIK